MTVTNYFVLQNSTADLTKRFKVIQSGYRPLKEKASGARKTVTGQWDISQGGIYLQHDYIIRVRAQESDTDYGTLADLETFFSYNSPSEIGGQPSNRLLMTTHYGDQWIVTYQGAQSPEALGVMLEGSDAVFLVKANFIFLTPVEGS